jgi:hypothetical protein
VATSNGLRAHSKTDKFFRHLSRAIVEDTTTRNISGIIETHQVCGMLAVSPKKGCSGEVAWSKQAYFLIVQSFFVFDMLVMMFALGRFRVNS